MIVPKLVFEVKLSSGACHELIEYTFHPFVVYLDPVFEVNVTQLSWPTAAFEDIYDATASMVDTTPFSFNTQLSGILYGTLPIVIVLAEVFADITLPLYADWPAFFVVK